jgi:hypothetical protein
MGTSTLNIDRIVREGLQRSPFYLEGPLRLAADGIQPREPFLDRAQARQSDHGSARGDAGGRTL